VSDRCSSCDACEYCDGGGSGSTVGCQSKQNCGSCVVFTGGCNQKGNICTKACQVCDKCESSCDSGITYHTIGINTAGKLLGATKSKTFQQLVVCKETTDIEKFSFDTCINSGEFIYKIQSGWNKAIEYLKKAQNKDKSEETRMPDIDSTKAFLGEVFKASSFNAISELEGIDGPSVAPEGVIYGSYFQNLEEAIPNAKIEEKRCGTCIVACEYKCNAANNIKGRDNCFADGGGQLFEKLQSTDIEYVKRTCSSSCQNCNESCNTKTDSCIKCNNCEDCVACDTTCDGCDTCNSCVSCDIDCQLTCELGCQLAAEVCGDICSEKPNT
jgi:hypothetical protein